MSETAVQRVEKSAEYLMRGTYVMRNGRLVRKEHAPPRPGSGIHIISDTMPAMRHPATGKLMDSKSQFRAITRAAGCVEVGNESQRDTRPMGVGGLKSDIAQAIRELGG